MSGYGKARRMIQLRVAEGQPTPSTMKAYGLRGAVIPATPAALFWAYPIRVFHCYASRANWIGLMAAVLDPKVTADRARQMMEIPIYALGGVDGE